MYDYPRIGPWSEIKIEIIQKYAQAYTKILSSRPSKFEFVYIDAFSGPGLNVSKETGEFVPGSPLAVMEIEPRFHEYHFIDLDSQKLAELSKLAGSNPAVKTYEGDCNELLVKQILPNVRYDRYRRGLCLLDPYGLHLDWQVVKLAGSLRTIDVFLNFPIHDMNRNVLRHDPSSVSENDAHRMTRFWGDDSWKQVAYSQVRTLFGTEEEKVTNREIVDSYITRLRKLAGFEYVAKPLPMRNKQRATIYYLLFASNQPVATEIVDDIYQRYVNLGLN